MGRRKGIPADQTTTDLTTREDAAAGPAVAGPKSAVQERRVETPENRKLAVGLRWQGFQITAPVPNAPPNSFYAENADATEWVAIYATPITPASAWRRGAWERLKNIPATAQIVGCVGVQEEEGWRYELMRQPPGLTLREWIVSHQASPDQVHSVLKQISATLAALHAQGVVHLNIRPETIYVEEPASDMKVWLGGTEIATLYTQPGIRVERVNWFYAPPEAADTVEFPPGTGLCAWDWWAVGRVLQELLLGRHVMELLFEVEITRPTPTLISQAHQLLLECDQTLPRAGVVEKMPEMGANVQSLLSGLLTSSRDARWGQNAVERWIKGENVSHHYPLPRHARMFVWKGRSFTIDEAVEFFSTADNWLAGEENLFQPDQPETLAYFLANDPEQVGVWGRLASCQALLDIPGWQPLPPGERRTLAASVAWLVLASENTKRTTFKIRGHPVDKLSLGTRLQKPQIGSGLDLVSAMTAPLFIKLVESRDPIAAGVLDRLARLSTAASELGRKHKWFDPAERNILTRLLSIALESDIWLKAKLTKVRETYALCADPVLLELLQKPNPEVAEQIVLVLTSEFASRFGYYSKAEWSRKQLAELDLKKQRLGAAIFWIQLHRLLMIGNFWTGRWPLFSTVWIGAVAVGLFLAKDPLITLLLAVALVAGRFLISYQVRKLVRLHDPEAKPWKVLHGPERCLAELLRIDPTAPLDSMVLFEQMLKVGHSETAGSESGPTEACPAPAAAFSGLHATLVFGSLFFLVLSAQFGADWTAQLLGRKGTAGSLERLHLTRVMPASLTEITRLIPGISPDLAAKVLKGDYEIVRDGFGVQLNGPLRKWDYAPPADPPVLPVRNIKTANPNQRAYAEVSGALLLAAFGHGPVNAFVAVQIPTHTGSQIMVFNGSDRELVDNQSLELSGELTPEGWYRRGAQRIVFLGEPEGIIDKLRASGLDIGWLELH